MEGSGSLPDGAFERFVTSALAAIITIVFSWRLLAEGQEQGDIRPRISRTFPAITLPNREEEDKTIDIPIDESVTSKESSSLSASVQCASLETEAGQKQDDEVDAPSWGDYKWEEDMYDTVHTRRSVNDFTVNKPSESSSSDEMESDIQLSPIPASHEMLEKLYMNQEYESINDSIDRQSESSSSSSDDADDMIEGVFEPSIMDTDMFYGNGLEPIIEEDSDDFSEDEDEDGEYQNKTYSITTGEQEPEGIRQEFVRDQSEKNISLPCSQDIFCQPDLADDNHNSLDNFIDECFDQLDEISDTLDKIDHSNKFEKHEDHSDNLDKLSDSSDSLPPSPTIRTRALDEESANFSDESFSGESVITVVSVKSDFSDTPEIQIVEESNKPLSFIYNNNESNEPDNLLTFIHGSNEKLAKNIDLDKTPDSEIFFTEISENEIQTPTLKEQLDYDDFVKDIQAVSETNPNENEIDENKLNLDKKPNKIDEVREQLNKEAAVTEETFTEVTELFITEELEHCDQTEQLLTESRKSDIDENIDHRFDDDEGPREYNPYEDDFAEFEYCDSDDDSFYLVCGATNRLPNFETFNRTDAGSLRNFETFTNLDAIGLSPGLDSPCESGVSDDGRFIFSRTEDIGTEFHTRVFVKDRDNETDLSYMNDDEIISNELPTIHSEVEDKNSYNESKLHHSGGAFTNGDPIISDLENIELFIDESRIPDKYNENDNKNEIIDLIQDTESIKTLAISDINNSQPSTNDIHEHDPVVTKIQSNDGSVVNQNTDLNGNSRDNILLHTNNMTEEENENKESQCVQLNATTCQANNNSKDDMTEKMSLQLADDKSENRPLKPGDNNSENISVQIIDNSSQLADKLKSNEELEASLKPCIEILSRAHDSGIDLDSDRSKSDSVEDFKSMSHSETKFQILEMLHNVKGQINRSSAVKPSLFKGGTKAKIKQQQKLPKSYFSVLQQPVAPDNTRSVAVVLPEKTIKLPKSRQQIIASRQKFLSEQNLTSEPTLTSDRIQEQFQSHKTSFEEVSQRKPRYVRRGNSLPRIKRTHKSYDKLDFNSLNSSRSSIEKPEICSLHENCMFTPHKHQEILDRTLSIDNLESSLMRYGSVTSLVETDIDSGETTEYQIFTDFDHDFEFQLPLQRTASMSELGTRIKNKKESKGRFSDRNVPKSKSLCTLETDIDEVFDETPRPGTLGRVPSVHELRVTKSLQKLNVPDWYKKSSVSRSGSTWSLYSSPRKDSFSSYNFPPSITSSPCPSVSLANNSVVIRTRITPTSSRLFRAPIRLQTTPEKSPTPISVQLPSDKLRQKDKSKELMPIPIVPFSKLRLMFEGNSRKVANKQSPSSPVGKNIDSPTEPVSPTKTMVPPTQSQATVSGHSAQPQLTVLSQPAQPQATVTFVTDKNATKPIIPAKPILKKDTRETKNVVRVEPQQTTPLNVQPMSTSPRSGRRVETRFNGSVGQSEKQLFSKFMNDERRHDLIIGMNDFPTLTKRSRHSDENFNPHFEKNGLCGMSKGVTTKSTDLICEASETTTTNNNSSRCISLEDVIEGLLAIDNKSKSCDDILNGHKTPNSSSYNSRHIQQTDILRRGFSSDSVFNQQQERFFDSNQNNHVLQTEQEDVVFCENCRIFSHRSDVALQFWTKCIYCNITYCSDRCKNSNWYIHKNVCVFGQISRTLKKVIKICNINQEVQLSLSQIARKGFNNYGNGCVHLTFKDNWAVQDFLTFGFKCVYEKPEYIPLNHLQSYFRSHTLPAIGTAIKNYNPHLKYILLVSFKNDMILIQKCAKLRLSPISIHIKPEAEVSSFVMLTVVSEHGRLERETDVINIQRKLNEKNIHLRHHYPKIYRKLIDFVSDGKYFSPFIFHPYDTILDDHITCVIMVKTEAEIDWLPDVMQYDYFLYDETLRRD